MVLPKPTRYRAKAGPEVVLVGPSLLQLSILETFRYNKEYKLIFGREVVF